MSDRPRRVAEAIKAELADLIAREVKDPRVKEGLVSVSHVEVNRDLSVAEVGVSILVGDVKAVMAGLEKAAGFLRGPLARRLKLRISPELRFHHDQSQAMASRIHAVVREDEQRRKEADGGGLAPGSGSADSRSRVGTSSPPRSPPTEPEPDPGPEQRNDAESGRE